MATQPPAPADAPGKDAPLLDAEAAMARQEVTPEQLSVYNKAHPEGPNATDSTALGALDTMSYGFADEAGALIDTLDYNPTSSSKSIWKGDGFSESIAQNLALRRSVANNAAETHPGYYLGGQIGGGFAPTAGLFGEARTFGSFLKGSIAAGFTYGLGSGEGFVNRVETGAKDAAIAAAASGPLYLLGKGIMGGARWVGDKLGMGAAEGADSAATAAAIPQGEPTPEGQQAYKTTGPNGEEVNFTAPVGSTEDQIRQAAIDATHSHIYENSEVVGWGTSPDGQRTPILAPKEQAAAPEVAGETSPSGKPKAQAQQSGINDESISAAATPEGEVLDPLHPQMVKQEMDSWLNSIHSAPESQAIADLPADHPQGQLTLGNLGSADDTVALQRTMLESLPPSPKRSDDDLLKTVAAAHADIGEEPDAILALGHQIAGKLGNADEAIALLRTTWNSATNEVATLHLANIDWSTADDRLVVAAGESIRNLSILSQQFQQAKAGLGRGLRALQLPDADTYMAQLLEKQKRVEAGTDNGGPSLDQGTDIPDNVLPKNREQIRDWFDLWGMMGGDPKKQAQFLQDSLTVPSAGYFLRNSLANLFTANVLSRPKTVLLNVVGPAFINGLRNLERASGAAVMSVAPGMSATDRIALRATAKEAALAPIRMLGDVGDAFSMGLAAAERNHTIIGGGGQSIDTTAQFGPLTENLLNAANVDPDWRYSLGNVINIFPKAFARVNNGLDEMAKRLTYQSEVRIHAIAEGSQKGLSGGNLEDFVSGKMQAAYDSVGHATDMELLHSAERSTLTATVGEEGTLARKFGSFVQKLRSDYPEMRFILPVFNVPANALGETLRRLPIAGIPHVNEALGFGRTAADLAGDNGIVAQADAHGRMMLGSAFLAGGVLLNRLGLLTGAGPQDKTDRAVWLQTHQPYSIRLGGDLVGGGSRDGTYEGGEWVSYNKFDVMGGLLSIPATVSDATTNHSMDKGVGDIMLAATGSLAQWFLDRGSMRTAAGLFALGTDPTNAASGLPRMMDSIAAGMIPASGALSSVVDVTDPYARQRNSWEDYMKTAIPGLSNRVEPVRNVLGEPVNRAADTYAESLLPVTFSSANSLKKDEVLDELDRMYQVSGYGAGADVANWGGGFFNPKTVKLENGLSLFDAAMKARQVIKADGQDLRSTLLDLFHSPEYADAADTGRPTKETPLGEGSREFMVQKVFGKFNKAIKANLAEASPIADRYLTAAAVKAKSDVSMDGTTADDLAKNPDLYKAHGIDAGAYSGKIKEGSSGELLDALSIED